MARIVLALGSEWDAVASRTAGQRAGIHHDILKFPLLGVAAVDQPVIREQLLNSVRTGSLEALNA